MIKRPQLIVLPAIGSSDLGYITIAQYQDHIPFEVKRVYWTYYTPNKVIRGHHAHKRLEQCIFAVSGSIEFELTDQHGVTSTYLLDSPEKGLYITPMHWRTIKFSHNAVLLCLASEVYDNDDYIRSLNEFLKLED